MSGNDERRPGQDGDSSSNSRLPKSTPLVRHAQPWHTVGVADLITARSLRTSWHITWRCVCGAKHRSIVRDLDGPTLRRTSPCGSGVVILHVRGVAAEVAA